MGSHWFFILLAAVGCGGRDMSPESFEAERGVAPQSAAAEPVVEETASEEVTIAWRRVSIPELRATIEMPAAVEGPSVERGELLSWSARAGELTVSVTAR